MRCETCRHWTRLPAIPGVAPDSVELGRCGWDGWDGRLTVKGGGCQKHEQRVHDGAGGDDVPGAGVRPEVTNE